MLFKRVTLICVLTVFGAYSWSDNAMREFKVSKYGALGDGATDDGPAIRAAFETAKEHAGASTVVFEKKRYLLGDKPEAWHIFVMDDFSDLIIEGNGATLVCSDANLAFHFNGGRNITVRGLTLDVTAPRVTQGEVVAVDKSGSMDVKIMDGYPEPPVEAFLEANHHRAWGGGGRHMIVFENGGQSRNTKMSSDHLYIRNIHKVSDGIFRFFVKEDYLPAFSGVAVGNWVSYGLNKASLPASVKAAKDKSASIYAQIAADRVANLTLEDITIVGSLNGGIRVSDMPGDVIFRNVDIIRKPGTRNLLSVCSDALHLMNIRGRVVMEDCVIEAAGDDCLNLGAQRENVVAVNAADDRKVTLRSTDHRYHYYTIRTGDRLQFLDNGSKQVLGERVVTHAIFDPRRLTHEVALDRNVPGLNPKTTQVMHLGQNTQSTVIRNCVVTPHTRNALLARAQNMTIEDNTIDCSHGGVLGLNLSFASGQDDARLRNVRVARNTFICPDNASLVAWRPYRSRDGSRDARNIAIIDNTFQTAEPNGVRINGVENLLWRGNGLGVGGKALALSSEYVSVSDCSMAEEPDRNSHSPTPYGADPADLVTPVMTDEAPTPGKRVRRVAPEYEGTEVYHTLYLPSNWEKGKTYPVIVEYTGNQWKHGPGTIDVANLGYGMSGGKDYIWVAMPYVEKGRKKNAVKWWGDRQATIDYCKVNLPRTCEAWGGDPKRVIVCGFSRGAIGTSYIGLADDEIAALWAGIFTFDHFDGQKEWGYPQCDRASALKRLARFKGRPVLVGGQRPAKEGYLENHLDLADFTFLQVPTGTIFEIPGGAIQSTHTDMWMHRDSNYRRQVRAWMRKVVGEKTQ